VLTLCFSMGRRAFPLKFFRRFFEATKIPDREFITRSYRQ
jgi:hypothetical protein